MENSSANNILKFFGKLFVVIAIILLSDFGVGKVLKHYYFRQTSGERFRTTYALDSTLADILVMGSSRANHSYIPEIFENRLPYSCYNTGSDGNYILYNCAAFKAITERYNPKFVIFEINPSDLEYSSAEYDRLSLLLPYYNEHPVISKFIGLRGPFEKLKLISSIYPYNSMLVQILAGNVSFIKLGHADIKGYIPLDKIIDDKQIVTSEIRDIIIDENKIIALKDIIASSREKNINLIFVYSPTRLIEANLKCHDAISELCSKGGIPFLDLSALPEFNDNPDYFADLTHLNDNGAKLFTNILIDKIWPLK